MKGDIEIRPLREDEVPGALALLRRQLAEHDIDLADDALERSVSVLSARRELGRVLVARENSGRVVGVAVVSFVWTLEHGGSAAWLDELYVDEALRCRGLGRRLVDAVFAVAAEHGALAVDLEVEEGHDAAARLYGRMGFHRHRRTHWVRRLDGGPPPGAAAARGATERGAHRPFPSLDHLSLGVNDLGRSKAFYDAALAPLGLVAHETAAGEVGYGPPGAQPQEGYAFYIGFEDPAARRQVRPSAGFHVALHAPSREAVRAFHAAAIAAGGRDLGGPGLRPQYHASYYGAFVADPDGHHVEAVCHAPEA